MVTRRKKIDKWESKNEKEREAHNMIKRTHREKGEHDDVKNKRRREKGIQYPPKIDSGKKNCNGGT